MNGTDDPRRGDLSHRTPLGDLTYRVGYATELIRQLVAHYDRGDEAALAHSVENARRFLAGGPDQ